MQCHVPRCECSAYSYKESEFTFPIAKWYSVTSITRISFCVVSQIFEISCSPRQRMGLNPNSGKRSFCFLKVMKLGLGLCHPPIHYFFAGVWSWQHISPSAEVESWWHYASSPHLCINGVCCKNFTPPIFMLNCHSWR